MNPGMHVCVLVCVCVCVCVCECVCVGVESRLEGKTGSQQPTSEVVAIVRVRTQRLKSDSQTWAAL